MSENQGGQASNIRSSLPQHVSTLIAHHLSQVKASLKAVQEKERAVKTLQRQRAEGQVPKSLRFNTRLVIPDCLAAESAMNDLAITNFNNAMLVFQQKGLDCMVAVANRAVVVLSERYNNSIEAGAQAIVDFFMRILDVSDPPLALKMREIFADIHNPLVTTMDLQPYVSELQSYLHQWEMTIATSRYNSIADSVAKSFSKEVKANAKKTAAEDFLAGGRRG